MSGLPDFVKFYKKHRRFLAGAVAHLLTPPELLGSRTGWVGFQFQAAANTDSLVFIYRLGAAGSAPSWVLRDLDPQGLYKVSAGLDGASRRVTGLEMMEQGLGVAVPGGVGDRTNAAAVVSVFSSVPPILARTPLLLIT